MSWWSIPSCLITAFLLPPLSQSLPNSPIKTCVRPACPQDGSAEVVHRLGLPVAINFRETPLQEVIDDLRQLTGVNMVIDQSALRECGIRADTPVSVKVDNVSVKTALNLILRRSHLTFIVRDDVVQVTTQDVARGRLVQKVYPVADLVIPTLRITNGKQQAAVRTREDKLMQLITNTVAPDRWTETGGPGTVQYFPFGHSLVVHQTVDVQEQVADLLAALRRLYDLETAVEVRTVRISPDTLLRMKSELQLWNVAAKRAKTPPTYFLDDTQVRQLMDMAQEDSRTQIVQTPRITLANGQRGVINVTDKYCYLDTAKTTSGKNPRNVVPGVRTVRLGQTLAITPVVSADRRYVHLKVDWQLTEKGPSTYRPLPTAKVGRAGAPGDGAIMQAAWVEKPSFTTVTVKQKAAVRDGRTVMWYAGSILAETRTEYDPPVLGQIPYVNRLFRTTGYATEPQAILVLVTPRIHVCEDEEVGVVEDRAAPIPRP